MRPGAGPGPGAGAGAEGCGRPAAEEGLAVGDEKGSEEADLGFTRELWSKMQGVNGTGAGPWSAAFSRDEGTRCLLRSAPEGPGTGQTQAAWGLGMESPGAWPRRRARAWGPQVIECAQRLPV